MIRDYKRFETLFEPPSFKIDKQINKFEKLFMEN